MNYLAFIIGGEGPDVWDKEILISATDISDAAKQAQAKAEELGGEVVQLSSDIDVVKHIQNASFWLASQTPFPYEYMGGGYFRKEDVPIGQTAEMLHGKQAIDKFRQLILALKDPQSALDGIESTTKKL